MSSIENISASQKTNEAKVLADIVEWSAGIPGIPDWQRDALRRLCESAELTDDDISELFQICKEGTGARPITHKDISDPEASAKKVSLKAIHKVENVNALKEGEGLQFHPTGLTVIYGNNGSGKSGYARILKEACGARGLKESKILPNAYNEDHNIPKAEILFYLNGKEEKSNWVKWENKDDLLSSVNIFDSITANIYVNDQNTVAYEPFPMLILNKLVNTCHKIKSKLENEISILNEQTPEALKEKSISAMTEVEILISKIQAGNNVVNIENKEIDDLAKFSAEEEEQLVILQKDLLETDIDKALTSLRYDLSELQKISEKYELLVLISSNDQFEKLQILYAAYICKKKTAILAANDLKNVPLGIESQQWKNLWESARKYSQEVAYGDKKFPVTEDNANCVLCQQVILPDAAERLKKFEKFINDDAKRQEQEALDNLKEFNNNILTTPPPKEEIRGVISFCEEKLNNIDLAQDIRKCFWSARRRLWKLKKQVNNTLRSNAYAFTILEKIEVPQDLGENFSAAYSLIKKRIENFTADNLAEKRKEMEKEKKELEGRKWLNKIQDDVKKELSRKKKVSKLNRLKTSGTTTAQITTKVTEISKILVTEALQRKFSKEVDAMKQEGLKLQLKQNNSKRGTSIFQIFFTSYLRADAKPGDILSEGEFRCIALAAFLAELATEKSESAIVFDDPVSSLDHINREVIAKRLASEALKRQVIIFTHDLYFAHQLINFCKDKDNYVEHEFRYIAKKPSGLETGICSYDAPLRYKNVSDRIKTLSSRLKNEKFHFEDANNAEWDKTLSSLYTGIRITWEHAIEDVLGRVLRRFSNKIDTTHLIELTVITEEDCKEMHEAYGLCSRLELHSQSSVSNPKLASPEEVSEQIQTLKKWYDRIRKEQKAKKSAEKS